jgi:spore coat protein CotH
MSLSIPDASVTSLGTEPKKYTAATFTITVNGYKIQNINVGVRLKGSTSLEKLSGHPSFKVAFNWGPSKGSRLVGLKNLTLNAMTQDTSKLHEFAAYKLHNAMNVPAPRTGWTTLSVNGVNKGLYLSLETIDDIFLGSKYTSITQHLYEGVGLKDFKLGNDNGLENTGSFMVTEGWTATPNKIDLKNFIAMANISDGATWWTRFGQLADRSEWIREWAVENFTGQWDGYSGPIINNYFIRSDLFGKFVIIPWGQDQTFGENRQTSALLDNYFFATDQPKVGFPWVQQAFRKTTMDRGMLFTKCLSYSKCRTEYLTQLKLVSAKATSIKLVTLMKNAAYVIRSKTTEAQKAEQVRTQNWVALQQTKVAAVLKKYGIR